MFKSACILIFLNLLWTNALDFDTPCPDWPVMQNIDQERFFRGIWYNLRKYDNKYQSSYDCTMTSFVLDGNAINRTTCERTRSSYYCMRGQVTFLNPEKKEAHFMYQDSIRKHMKIRGSFLTTDYDNYYLSYACVNKGNGTSKQMAWLYSRTTQLSDAVKDEVEELIAKHFKPESLFPVYQKEEYCSPRPKFD